MWIIVNLLITTLALVHLFNTPRFQKDLLKKRGLEWTAALFIWNVIVVCQLGSYQHPTLGLGWETHPLSLLNITANFSFWALDGISAPLIVLSTGLIPVCLLASWKSLQFLIKEFILCLIVLDILLILSFASLDLIWFYILFEGLLIPMFIIIGVWGSRADKVTAAFYFFFFTLAGSLTFLISIFGLYHLTGSTQWIVLYQHPIPDTLQYLFFLGFALSFAVKIPQFPAHIWLPQAHVEAPVAGSVLLAGILLKLGGYGYLRFCLPLFPQAVIFFTPLMITLGILGVLWGSINTLRQADMKRLVAYSSVAHMGLVTLTLFSQQPEAPLAALLMMVAHGLVSPALFIMVTLLYDRFHTRLIRYYRGVALGTPLLATALVILSLMNMSLPPTSNFVAEFISLWTIFQLSPLAALLAGTGVILSAGYSLWFCNRVCFGTLSPHLKILRDLSRREALLILPLIFIPAGLGFYPHILAEGLTTWGTLTPNLF